MSHECQSPRGRHQDLSLRRASWPSVVLGVPGRGDQGLPPLRRLSSLGSGRRAEARPSADGARGRAADWWTTGEGAGVTREVCEAVRVILMAVAAILLALAIDRAIETWRGARVVVPAAWEYQQPPGGPRS